MPDIEALAAEFKGRATVVKIDTDRLFLIDKTLRKQFNIGALPLLILYKDGVEMQRFVGADQTSPAQLKQGLTATLADADVVQKTEGTP